MMRTNELYAEMAHIAANAGSVERRAGALLECLRDVVPYSAGWIAVRDPETRMHRRVASAGDTDALVRYFALSEADEELEQLGLNRFQPPVPASAIGVPLAETRAWGEFLLPAGLHDGVAMGLFSHDGRHLGFLSLLTHDPAQRTDVYGGLLAGLRPIFARALDRLPSFVAAAELTADAVVGVVITRTGRKVPLPTLPPHPLLDEGSAALAMARRCLAAPGTTATFVTTWAGSFVRISVLDCRDESADHLTALVLVRPPGEAQRLGRTNLRLLGALVAGWDDKRIRASSGLDDMSGRSSRLASELGFSDVGALVQHAAQEGLYLPPPLWQ
jgi:hypothetical protein